MVSRRYISPVPEQGTLSTRLVNRLRARLPSWTPDASDPAVYWADDTAGAEIARIEQHNDSADANWVVTATSQALRELANNVGILTFPAGVTDDQIRQQIYDQFNALAPGTPPYDKLLARLADPLVADVARSLDRANDRATIYVLDEDAENLPAANRTAIQAALNVPNRPAFWLDYVVAAATITDYTVDATVTYRRGAESPEGTVLANLEATMLRLRKLDTAVNLADLSQGMWVRDIVTNVAFTSPATDLARSPDTVYHGTVGTLTFAEEA